MALAGTPGPGMGLRFCCFIALQGNAENSHHLHLVGHLLQGNNQRTDSKIQNLLQLELTAAKISSGARTKEQTDKWGKSSVQVSLGTPC